MPISSFLSRVSLAPRQAHKALCVWPLVRHSGAPSAGYRLLAEALARGEALVDEVGESGTVPHVRVVNRGAAAVLVLFGEELRGAKQNRIANASFLVAPESDLVIDVSCVEHGRWARRCGAAFDTGHGVVSHAMRRKMAEQVRASRDSGHGFRADQGEVWDGSERYDAGVSVPSESNAR